MITTTARELIVSSFRLCGILAAEETASAAEQADALSTLNALIDSWGIQPLTMRTTERNVFDLVSGQQSYTVGEEGDWALSPPNDIGYASVIQAANDPPNEIPLAPLTQQAYEAILIKDMSSGLPTQYYYGRTTPALATFWLWPLPTDSDLQVALYTDVEISQFPNVTTEVDLAPGYFRCLRYNLAVELAAEYTIPVDPRLETTAAASLRRIKAANYSMSDLGLDAGLLQPEHGWYNIQTDRP